jgi:copper/silver efflux system protein
MIHALIHWSLRNRFLVVCATLFACAMGFRAVRETPVDAIPDLSENQVIVYADWPGRSPQEVEDQITQLFSTGLQGLAGVQAVRGSSMFGASLLTVVFADEVPTSAARQSILERLSFLDESLPSGVKAKLGPDATGLGWIYQYYLEVDPTLVPHGKGYDLGELRALQDYHIRQQLQAVPGVAEVASVGGFVRQYQIEADSFQMRARGISLNMIMMAVEQSNLNVGGKTIEENGQEFVVRGVGLIQNASDLEKIVLMMQDGAPVYLKDVARIEMGGDFRRGALDAGGHEVVGGTVVMRTGENARAVVSRVKSRITQLSASLPPGVVLKCAYDRGELIDRAIDTLKTALSEEIILVTLVHIIFLFHFRSILIVTLPLPMAILLSFLGMRHLGLTSNIMSLSGIAIAIGVLVDAAIVITENVIRQCEQKGSTSPAVILAAIRQVGRPVVFALGIIILAFLPVFALSGQEGKLFHPLAFAKTFALLGAALLSVTIVPVLCAFFVRGPFHAEERNLVMRALLRLYDPVLDFALNHRRLMLACAAAIFAGALALVPRMGSEFMPPLNEGSLLFMPSLVPSTSLTEIKRVMSWQDQVLAGFPEVRSAVGKLGRADTATDPAPTEMIETTIMLKPEAEWRPGMTREKLIAEMTSAMRNVPGSVPGFLQPIEGRVLMLATGIRSQLGVKIFGSDPGSLQQSALEVQRVVQEVPGATGVAASRSLGKPYVNIQVNRDAMSRFGLHMKEVLDVVEAGLGGRTVTTVIEGRRRVPVQVRLQKSERDDLTRIKDVLVTASNGTVIPLGQIADISRTEGPGEIASENGRLRAFVQANVSGRDLGGFVAEVQSRLKSELETKLASQGMTLEFSGDYEHQLHAAHTLLLIVPAVLLIIFVLLFQLYGSAREAAHVILAVPFALSGGVMLQYAMGWHFSVAVWVGYIALFGTAIQTAVVMVVYLHEAVQQRRQALGASFTRSDLIAAIKEGARLRLRPKVMTVATIIASLLPVFWSHRSGSEIMQPIGAPIIGGMISSLLHILILTPVIFFWIHERDLPAPCGKSVE